MTKQTEKKYRIRNWAEYNRALINRGSLTVWFEDSATNWKEKKRTGKKGRPRTYSDDAILCALVLRAVYHLPLRALQGFLQWVFQVMQTYITDSLLHSNLPQSGPNWSRAETAVNTTPNRYRL